MDPNSMPDPFLSQYFGTAPAEPMDGDSLEKVAQLHLLEKLAEDENLDLTQYSDDEILAMTDQVFGEDGGYQAPGAEYTDFEKMAAAKVEEANYLGRVMAHSMWNELDAIQKAAAGSGAQQLSESEADAFAKEVKSKKSRDVAAAKERHWAKEPSAAGQGHSGAKTVGKTEGAVRSALHKMKTPKNKRRALIAGGAALGTAALTAGGVLGARALKKRKEEQEMPKAASALETMADSRAFDILAEYGYVTPQGEVIPPEYEPGQPWEVPYVKTASAELDNAIEDLAWGKLYDLGYLG